MLRKALQATLAALTFYSTGLGPASAVPALPTELRPLNVAAGRWTYHGKTYATRFTKAGDWTWNVECNWATNQEFLICSFDMNWPEGPDRSVSLATYNKRDHAYWHYEVMDDEHGDKPVVSRMIVAGNTWTEMTQNINANGNVVSHFRVIYTFQSPTTVQVTFKSSKDGVHWSTLGTGVGHKER